MAKRKIDPADGMRAVAAWVEQGDDTARRTLATAVRFTLEELGILYPGRSVEVRVPPAGAVQILQGTTHRRGTPPAVIETDPHTWLELVTGRTDWAEVTKSGRVVASGERTDLSAYLPLDGIGVPGEHKA
ncbi:sterol carrier family protein [Schaalia sp. ZJ1691]|uniref:sterol carrier family protein n=1 Tax=Schaalia sp. ZJ1691 TaxID=2709404 RepID=UPI0013ED64F5|nr:sterol carrier family protein [Schaalia sp. ZJ1691]